MTIHSTTSEFDVSRIGYGNLGIFEKYQVKEMMSLQEAINQKIIETDTPVLVLEVGHDFANKQAIVLPTIRMSFHGVAQGHMNNEAWMVIFCVICNSGMAFSPVVNGLVHQFSAGGIYNGMQILKDEETQSYWELVTGKCLYGELVGYQLESSVILHMTSDQALKHYPHACFAFSKLKYYQQMLMHIVKRVFMPPKNFMLLPFRRTMLKTDNRRAELDMGLGIWAYQSQRYYPLNYFNRNNNVIIDTIDGRTMLIYIDPKSKTPMAFYFTAKTAVWQGGELIVNDKYRVYDRLVFDENGTVVPVEYPKQFFTRWYGFSFTFPQCEIYDAG